MTGTLVIAVLLLGGGAHPKARIAWEHDFEKALRKARVQNRPVLVDFWADWCSWCHLLDETTYVDPRVVELSSAFVAVKVDTEGSSAGVAVATRYNVDSLPTIAFLSPSGRQVFRLAGFQGPGQFPRTLETAKAKADKVMAWEAALENNPGDSRALMQLGVHLYDQDEYKDSRDLLSRASRCDVHHPLPERKKVRLLLGVIHHYDRDYSKAEELLLEALRLGQDAEQDPYVLYVLGRNYLKWGRKLDARRTLKKLVERYPDSPMAEKAWDTLMALEAGSPR